MTDAGEGSRTRSRDTSALWERVEGQGSAIRALAEETSSQFRDFRGEVSLQIAGLATSIEKVSVKFEASAVRMAEAQRPQYLGLFGAMVAAVGVSITIMQTLSSLHDKPVDDKLTTLSQNIADLNKNTAASIDAIIKNTQVSFGEAARNTVSQREFSQTIDFENRVSDIKTEQRKDQSARLQAQIDKVAGDEVSRSEHQFHWIAEDKIDTHLEDEITQISHRLDNLVSPGDTIKALAEREHELEIKVFGAH